MEDRIHTVRVTNRKRKGHGQCPWTTDNEGPLLEATVGGSEVTEFILESGERSKSPGRAGNHSHCYLLKMRIISLEREDRHVLKQLSHLGNDTVLDRSFSSLFNLQRDCEKTEHQNKFKPSV